MIRNGIPADAEAIEEVRIAAWQAAYRQFLPSDFLAGLDATQNLEGLRERLASQDIDFSLFVAEHESAVSAFSVLGKPRFEAPSDTIELWALNVHPRCWRLGLGQQLIQSVIDSAQTAGFKTVELWCIDGNTPAEAAYAKAGFVPTGRTRTSSGLTGHPIQERHYFKDLFQTVQGSSAH